MYIHVHVHDVHLYHFFGMCTAYWETIHCTRTLYVGWGTTHSERAVLVEFGGLGCGLKVGMLIHEPLDVASCVNLLHTDLNPLHPFQIGWCRVG